MKLKYSGPVLGLLTATLIAGSLSMGGGPAVGASSARDVRVGSFNIVGVSADSSAHGTQKTWKQRRSTVASQILSRDLDVVGVQEANQSSIYKSRLTYGSTQYNDLAGALNHMGGHYALTNTNAYNCATPRSSYRCKAKNMGASGDNRILYDTTRVSRVSAGALTYSAHAKGKSPRYLAWAVLRMKGSGKKFLFTTTHLDPYSISARKSQWNQMIAKINSLKGSLPVVATGDFNTSKFSDYARTYIPRMKSNGYGDVLNQVPNQNTLKVRRAQSVSRAWIASFNAFRSNVKSFSYYKDRSKIGNGIDWIFASNRLQVKRWEVVVNINPTTLSYRGTIPSDHNLVVSTLVI